MVAYCSLEATRNLCNKFFNEETFEYVLDSERDGIPYAQDYVKYCGLTEKQANYFVDFLYNYVPAKSIRASWKLPPAEVTEEEENTSSNVTVEFRDRWASSARHEMNLVVEQIVNSHIVPSDIELHMVFYGLNTVTLEAPDDDAYDLVIALASGTSTYQRAAEILAKWHEPTAAERGS